MWGEVSFRRLQIPSFPETVRRAPKKRTKRPKTVRKTELC
jgi:hypothetical protein